MKKIIRNSLFNLSLIAAIAALTACGGSSGGPPPSNHHNGNGTTCKGTKQICVSANTSLPILSKPASANLDKTLGATGGPSITFTSSESVAADVKVIITVKSGASFIKLGDPASCKIAKGANTCSVSISATASATSASTSTLGYSTAGVYNMTPAKQTFTFEAVPRGVLRVRYEGFPPIGPPSPQKVTLSDPAVSEVLVSSILAGVMYSHLIKSDSRFSSVVHGDYLYATLFGQLIQESSGNLDSRYMVPLSSSGDPSKQMLMKSYPPGSLTDYANTSNGSGGSWQINDYGIRIPYVGEKGAVGLLNYNALHAAFNASAPTFTIKGQDARTWVVPIPAPPILNNLYIGPMFATFFEYNKLNSTYLSSTASNADALLKGWKDCITSGAATKPGTDYILNMIMTSVYNSKGAGGAWRPYINLCTGAIDKPDVDLTLDNLNSYDKSDSVYGGLMGVSNPNQFYIKYPRQVNFYIDQLYNNNTSLKPSGITVDNSQVTFSIAAMQRVFENTMMQLGYRISNGDLKTILKPEATKAFITALKSNGLDASSKDLNLSNRDSSDVNSSDRAKIFKTFHDAISNLEIALKFKFSDTSEKD